MGDPAQGFRHNRAIYSSSTLPDMSAKTLGRYPDIKPSFESVNVEGLYFAGTLAQCRDFRRAGSGKRARWLPFLAMLLLNLVLASDLSNTLMYLSDKCCCQHSSMASGTTSARWCV